MATVLVVDDSKVDRLLIGGLLEGEPELEVHFAENGAQALERVAAEPPDLVITDLVMPELNGLELVSKIRESQPRVPIILVTSQGSEEIAVQALRAGAASYVPKASLASILPDVVETVLEASRADRIRAQVTDRMVSSQFQWELPPDRSVFSPLVNYLQDAIAGLTHCDETDRTRIGVALEEALVNAAEHGNLELDSALRQDDRGAYLELMRERQQKQPYCDRRVHLSTYLDRQQARFVIRDEGKGFDPHGLPDPTDPQNLLKASGRGVMLMRTFMDEVTYNETGNEVTLIKRCGTSCEDD
jgi:CheY-like chemotaxis protein